MKILSDRIVSSKRLVLGIVLGALVGSGATPEGPSVPRDRPDVTPGLVMTARFDKRALKVSGLMLLTYGYTNKSRSPIVLWQCGFWPNHSVVVKDELGKEPPLTPFGTQCRAAFLRPGRDKNAPFALKPGASYQGSPIEVNRLYQPVPGRYRLTLTYEDHFRGKPVKAVAPEVAFDLVP